MEETLRIAVFGDSLMKGTLPDSCGIIFTPTCSKPRSPGCTPR